MTKARRYFGKHFLTQHPYSAVSKTALRQALRDHVRWMRSETRKALEERAA